jgi:hypothetical protein
LDAIASARRAEKTDELSMTTLLKYAYPTMPRLGIVRKKWQYQALKVALQKIATPLGRRSGKGVGTGRPMWWRLDPAKLEERSWRGREDRRRAREGLPPLDRRVSAKNP